MTPAPEWQRLLTQLGDIPPGATLGERTVIMAETTPTSAPLDQSRTEGTSGRTLQTELSTQPQSRYRFRERIGRGGMGEILRVEQTSIGRDVALKTLRGDRRDRGLSEAFLAETRVTAGLEHPGVVPVHDAGIDYLTMKLVEGRTLASLLAEREGLEDGLADLIEILVRIADCLAFAHSRGILHRDLKPDNVMVGGFGEVYLMDWGLALAFGADIVHHQLPHVSTASNICAGSPAYLPPEVARGERFTIGAASDVFGLGAILHEVLGGEPPFGGDSLQETLAAAAGCRVRPLPPAVVATQSELAGLVDRMLASDPRQRCPLVECQRSLRGWLEVSGRREAARRHHAAATRALEQATAATRSGTIYHLLTQCANECERALALDQRREDSRQLRADAHRRYAEEAIRAGDLVLAQAVLDEDDDPALDPLRERVAAGFERRRRLAHRTRQARRWSARLALLAAGLLVLASGFRLIEVRHHRQLRRAQAEGLIAGTLPSAQAPQTQHQRAVNRSLRALGLHPEPREIEERVRAAALGYVDWAIAHDSATLARAQLRLAERHGLERAAAETIEGSAERPGTIAWAATATERRRAAERERRRERLAAIETEAAGRRLEPDWLPKRLAELCSWRAAPDDPATAMHTAELFTRLRQHRDPLLRMLAQGVRNALEDDPATTDLIAGMPPPTAWPLCPGDPDPRVQEQAIIDHLEHQIETLPAVMEAVVALGSLRNQNRVGFVIEDALDDWFDEHIEDFTRKPTWIGLSLILSYRRFLLTIDRDSEAERLRWYWEDTLGRTFSRLRHHVFHGRYDRCIELSREILNQIRSDYAFSNGAGAAYLSHSWKDLVELCELWHHQGGERPITLPFLAGMALSQGEGQLAQSLLDEAMDHVLDGHSIDHDAMVRLMIALRQAKRSDEAILVSRLMAERRPTLAMTVNNIGWTLHEAGRHHEAIDQAIRTLEGWPGNWRPWGLLVFVRTELGDFRGAIEAGERLLERRAGYGGLYGELVIANARLGRRQQALAMAQRGFASTQSAEEVDGLREGIRIAWLEDERELLLQLLQSLVAVAPDSAWNRGLLVRYHLEQGDPDAALDAVEAGSAAGHPIGTCLEHLLLAHPRGAVVARDLIDRDALAGLHLREALALLAWPAVEGGSTIDVELSAARSAAPAVDWIHATADWIAAAAGGRVAPAVADDAVMDRSDWAGALLTANPTIRRDPRGQPLIHAGEDLWVWRPRPLLAWTPEREARLAALLHSQAGRVDTAAAPSWHAAATRIGAGP